MLLKNSISATVYSHLSDYLWPWLITARSHKFNINLMRHNDDVINSKPSFLKNFGKPNPHAKFGVSMTFGLGQGSATYGRRA